MIRIGVMGLSPGSGWEHLHVAPDDEGQWVKNAQVLPPDSKQSTLTLMEPEVLGTSRSVS